MTVHILVKKKSELSTALALVVMHTANFFRLMGMYLVGRSTNRHFHVREPYLPKISDILTLLLLNTTCPVLANSVVPDQLASSEAN